jgi:hypothetical protein
MLEPGRAPDLETAVGLPMPENVGRAALVSVDDQFAARVALFHRRTQDCRKLQDLVERRVWEFVEYGVEQRAALQCFGASVEEAVGLKPVKLTFFGLWCAEGTRSPDPSLTQGPRGAQMHGNFQGHGRKMQRPRRQAAATAALARI